MYPGLLWQRAQLVGIDPSASQWVKGSPSASECPEATQSSASRPSSTVTTVCAVLTGVPRQPPAVKVTVAFPSGRVSVGPPEKPMDPKAVSVKRARPSESAITVAGSTFR